MRVDALILDMDGVLADTEPLHVRAWENAMREIFPSSVNDADSLRAFHAERGKMAGMASVDIARRFIAVYRLSLQPEVLLSRKREIYRALIADISPFPGLPVELEHWRKAPLGLATSSSRVETAFTLDTLGFAGIFHVIVTSDDVPNAKPAPDCYILAARRLGMAPRDCFVIEDSGHGIRAALAAGARVLAVGGREDPSGIDGVTAHFSTTVEALQWLRK
jgi:HAD superfamily hydrolase (TIGR01509 family)